MRRALPIVAVLLWGCLPDLGAWRIAPPGADGGPIAGQDGGSPEPNPIDLGPPCPNPYLLLGTLARSGGDARVLRVDATSGSLCRTSPLLEVQRAFGPAIRDVDWHVEVGEILGLDGAVLVLDGEGFPRWRYQPFGSTDFRADWVAAFGSGPSLRIAAAWSERSSSLSAMLLLDAQGARTSGDIQTPFFAAVLSAHPDGSRRVALPSRAGPDLDVYAVDDATTRLSDATDATPMFAGGTSLPTDYGNRAHLGVDATTQRVTIAHERGVALWRAGTPGPTVAVACPSYCASFQAAAPHPTADDVFAICVSSAGSARHLVRIASGRCDLVIDGTALTHTLQDLALVRAAL